MKKWKEVEREIVAERLKEISFHSGDEGLREFIERHCASSTEFYRIWARYKVPVFGECDWLRGRLMRGSKADRKERAAMLARFESRTAVQRVFNVFPRVDL